MSDGSMPTRFRVGTWVISERRSVVYEGSRRGDNALEEQTAIDVPLISLDARLTPRLGLQFTTGIPLIVRTGTVHRASGPLAFRDEVKGLGDTTAGVWYRGTRQGWTWTLNGGMSIPTGSTRKPVFRPELEGGSLVPLSRLSRGSGTWDPLLGVAVERHVAGGRWVSSLAARTPVAENDDGLRIGASWELGTGWAHTIGTHKVMGYVRADWLHREQDVFSGTPVLVGGGNWLYASPGVAVMVGKGVNVQAEVKLPAYRYLANRQLDSRAIFQLGVSRSF
jgi:hypothetical protein